MSVSDKTWGVLKSVIMYQETIKAVREDMVALSQDVVALSHAHTSLSERVSRLEGYIRGRADQATLQRLPGGGE